MKRSDFMQILTDNNLCMFYGNIEKGIYDADPSRELYKITNPNGEVMYAVTSGFDLYEVDSLPEDFKEGLYCYTAEQGFYLNPDYKEPKPPIEERVTELEENSGQQQADIDYLLLLIE